MEAVLYDENLSSLEKDVKKIFETLTSQKQKVKGTNVKFTVNFIVIL